MKKIVRSSIITLILGLIIYYLMLPAINLKAKEFYIFFLALVLIYIGSYSMDKLSGLKVNFDVNSGRFNMRRGRRTQKMAKGHKIMGLFIGLPIIILIIGTISSLELFHSSSYQQLMTVQSREFVKDITQVSINEVPVVDKDSAVRLGNRKLGELVDLVSQFEVDENKYSYTQINYQGTPTRVAPLRYGDFIKWFNNKKEGLPGYIKVDMATQNVELVQVEGGIKYSPGEYFFKNLSRHLRFQYPTYIFDDYSFEVDDEGNPFWICPVVDYTIGLFGGKDIKGVVIVNAVDGSSEYFDISEVPSWVDQAYSSSLVVNQIDYWGKYKNGFFNTVIGQKDVIVTSGGYNYLALEDDVWLYTGLTSVGTDESNIGFVLVNLRTKESRYYVVSGATEYSAMESAEGQVQHLQYQATFPVLLNIGNQPTYFISLKDNAGLVKKFAYVNVEKYQMVGIGDTIDGAYVEYLKIIAQNTQIDTSALESTTGTVSYISSAVKDGNTYYFIQLEDHDKTFTTSIKATDVLAILKEGDQVEIHFIDAESEFITINEIKKIK